MSAKRKIVLVMSGASTIVWVVCTAVLLFVLSQLATDLSALEDSTVSNASADTVGGWATIGGLIGAGFGGMAWLAIAVIGTIVGLLAAVALVMWILSVVFRKRPIAFRVTATIGQIPLPLAGLCLVSGDPEVLAVGLGLIAYFVLEMVLLYTDRETAGTQPISPSVPWEIDTNL
ncbi:MAG: hypothetical protein LUH09_01375 [Clostridiales bacterium]|nr:hypothetical protein [Clostridiales bacterium]